ncbi:MAG: ABC transporter permease [Defluviitaleaceae bacterium]|nr:ABC transporter permease [Defluviitaleaceae bacterium]MCL2261946.1 ABC transporter permease [Defluviitaleaceae bacterium]
MNLAAKLAYAQLITHRRRTLWTILGIVLSVSMLTAVFGFAFSGFEAFYELSGGQFRAAYYTMFMTLAGMLSLIIFTASVIVMSNAFRVSAAQRMQQFGILKSVGATKRQITRTVLYEGFFLTVVALPIGVILGLAVQYVGLYIANILLQDINRLDDIVEIGFVVAWQAIIISVLLGFFTVLVSAWLPARKAAQLPAIDAIRLQGETKIKNARPRKHLLVQKLFGFEGALAAKSLRRDRRNFRATVVSLSISIFLFLAASSFGAHLAHAGQLVINPVDADIIIEWHSNMGSVRENDDTTRIEFTPLDLAYAEQITARMRAVEGVSVVAAGSTGSVNLITGGSVPAAYLNAPFRDYVDPDHTQDAVGLRIFLVAPDAQTYAELARAAGVPHGSNILVNFRRIQVDERWTEFIPINFNYQTLSIVEWDDVLEVPLHGQLRGDQVPNTVLATGHNSLVIIVPYVQAKTYHWYILADAPIDVQAQLTDIVLDFFPLEFLTENNIRLSTMNIAANNLADRALMRLLMVFIYGFVGMLTLVGLTNVISTLSTNIRARRREFAVLQSVGMTHGGLNRMLNLESILCSIKSLAVGLPLGLGASYAIYRAFTITVDFPYIFPLWEVLACIGVVFIITWVTMRFAAARLRGGSMVEGIRGC